MPLAFFSFVEELLQGPADETCNKKDDILMFMMLEEFMKNCRNAQVCTESCIERIVPATSDSSFRQHFRLLRLITQRLVNLLGTCPEIPVPRERGRPTVEIEKQLLITLWYLGNPECIRSVSDQVDVHVTFNHVESYHENLQRTREQHCSSFYLVAFWRQVVADY